MNKLEWIQDPIAEQCMDRMGLKYTIVHDFDLRKLIPGRLERNIARPTKAIDQADVDALLGCMKGGHKFKMGVHRMINGQGDPLGGHRRDCACLAWPLYVISTYIVKDCSDEEAEELAKLLNRVEGRGQSAEEIMAFAVEAVTRFGKEAKDAAARWDVDLKPLQARLRAVSAENAMTTHGVANWEKLPEATKVRLRTIQNDKVLAEVAKLLITRGIIGSAMVTVIKEVKDAHRSQEAQMAVIDKWKATTEPIQQNQQGQQPLKFITAKPRAPKSLHSQFTVALRMLETIVQGKRRLADFDVPEEDRPPLLKRIYALGKRLSAIYTGSQV